MDTLSTARNLEAAGFERLKAEAIAAAIWRYHERAATKADLEPLATKAELSDLEKRMASKADLAEMEKRIASKAELSDLETRLTNRFYGVGIALAGVVIASVKLL